MSDIFSIGDYTGMVSDDYRSDDLVAALAEIAGMMSDNNMVSGGRNRHARLKLPSAMGEIDVAVKSFSKQLVLKERVE